MATLLIITGLILFLVNIILLYRSASQSFIITVIHKWYEAKHEESKVTPQAAKEFMTSNGSKSAKGMTGLLIIVWFVFAIMNQHWVLVLAGVLGLVSSLIVVKMVHSRLNVREAIRANHKTVLKRRQYIGQLSANDIATNTPKYQLSNLDFLLENKEFIDFAQKQKHNI